MRVLGDDRLAAPGRRRDQRPIGAGVEGVEGLQLEAVERELVASEDRLAVRPHVSSFACRPTGYGSVSALALALAACALEDPTDEDREEVEHGHRHRQRDQRDRGLPTA